MESEFIAQIILYILVGLIIIAIIIICVVAANDSDTLSLAPDTIDVVLWDQGRQRTSAQVERIDKYLPWVTSIIILKSTIDLGYPSGPISTSVTSSIPIIQVQSTKDDQEQALLELPSLYDCENILYFGDVTFPIQSLLKSQLWSISKKLRLFNYFQPDAVSIGLDKDFENTMPVSLINMTELTSAGSMKDFLLSMVLANSIVFSPTFNKTILFIDNEFTDSHQVDTPPENTNYFSTLLISPNVNQESMNDKVLKYFE